MNDFYAEDLAYAHDTDWADFARAAGPGVVARLRAAGIAEGRVVSIACGSGILERALVDAGYAVHGIDISSDMLAIARRRVPEATFVQASALDAELPACAAVVAAGEGLGYLADPRLGSAGVLREMFARVHAALAPGGLFLFDLVETQGAHHAWVEGDGYLLCVDTTATAEEITRRIVVFRRVGDAWRRSDETHGTRLHPRADVLAALRAAGFEATTFPGYAEGSPLRPGVVGYAARR